MKNVLLITSFLATAIAFGQYEVGAKAGGGLLWSEYGESSVFVNEGQNHMDIAIEAGGYFQKKLSKQTDRYVYINADLLFGYRAFGSALVGSTRGTNDIQQRTELHSNFTNFYIDLPVSIRYGFKTNKKRYGDDEYLGFYAGPLLSARLISSIDETRTEITELLGQTSVIQEKVEYNDEAVRLAFNRFMAGAHIGAHYRFEFGVSIDLRYSMYFSPILSEEDYYGKLSQNMLTLSATYRLWDFNNLLDFNKHE